MMDVAGAIFRQSVRFSSTSYQPESFPVMKKPGSGRKSVVSLASSDKIQLEHYNGTRMSVEKEDNGLKKKEMKKKLKLFKGLSKNLNTFSDMGFGLDPDNVGLDHRVKSQIISEATEVLLAQLQKLKAQKMESKRIKKEEKSKKKAAQTMTKYNDTSSSSSSESDCKTVTNMARNSRGQIQQVENAICKDAVSRVDVGRKTIEVCMGGKCKKSGAAMLLENLQAAAGGEAAAAAVVGCKCMGKCKDGLNVRVRSEGGGAELSPLCVGVGPEDVESIVTGLFGGSRGSCSGTVPALSGV